MFEELILLEFSFSLAQIEFEDLTGDNEVFGIFRENTEWITKKHFYSTVLLRTRKNYFTIELNVHVLNKNRKAALRTMDS